MAVWVDPAAPLFAFDNLIAADLRAHAKVVWVLDEPEITRRLKMG